MSERTWEEEGRIRVGERRNKEDAEEKEEGGNWNREKKGD